VTILVKNRMIDRLKLPKYFKEEIDNAIKLIETAPEEVQTAKSLNFIYTVLKSMYHDSFNVDTYNANFTNKLTELEEGISDLETRSLNWPPRGSL